MQPLPATISALLVLIASIVPAAAQLPVPPPVPAVPAPVSPPAEESQPDPDPPKGPPPSPQQLDELTERLSSDDFKTREFAQLELTKIATAHPDVALDPILRSYLKKTIAPEARYRLRAILYNTRQAEFEKVPRGFVGIVMYPSFARGAGGEIIHAVQVRSVVEGSAAERHGLQLMDQIISIDEKTFSSTESTGDFADYVTSKSSGDKVELTIMRNNERMKIPLTLGKRPKELADPRARERFDQEFNIWLDENTARLRENKD